MGKEHSLPVLDNTSDYCYKQNPDIILELEGLVVQSSDLYCRYRLNEDEIMKLLEKVASIFLFGILSILIFLISCTGEQSKAGLKSGKGNLKDVISAMTLEEKVSLVVGNYRRQGSSDSNAASLVRGLVPGAAGTTMPIPKLGITSMVMADGPAGLRINPTRENDIRQYYCTAFPVATLLASSWDTELVYQVGQAMGNEVREFGADILLAPAFRAYPNNLEQRNVITAQTK